MKLRCYNTSTKAYEDYELKYSLIESLRLKIKALKKDFVVAEDLVILGIYDNKEEVRRATRRNDFPFIRVSRNRVLIPVDSFIEYLEKSTYGA